MKSAVPAATAIVMPTKPDMRVMLGMSGGVDSYVAALLLKQSGADVLGVTLRLTEDDNGENARDAAAVAAALGIPHTVYDLRAEFNTWVTDYFVQEFKCGRTPNPCIICNKKIKFGKMLDIAKEHDCAYIATGHYAKVEQDENNGLFALKKASCAEKDQTYFLYTLNQETLSKVLMPLGSYQKAEVRALAEEFALISAKSRDSQDICFIPDGDKNRYLKQFLPETPGRFVDVNGNILGAHKGIFHYTVGQRKGLGIAFGKPMFVLSIHAESNTIVLGEAGSEFSRGCLVTDCNFIPFIAAPDGLECMCKVRYSAKETPCRLTKTKQGYDVQFSVPQRAITPGQAAVFYVDDTVIGGGTIVSPLL